jgi:dipeptidyl aminopeptidase/acylaminoacyl peptidase
MKTGLNILFGIALLAIALSFVLVYTNTHPPRYPLHVPPSDLGRPYDRVSFVTEDGVTPEGWLVGPDHVAKKAPAVIICHGLGANKSDFTDLAVQRALRGYWALTFDFRAHGKSGGSRSSLGYHEQKDVKAAHAFLLSRQGIDRERIGMFGFSLGGSIAILAAASSRKFAAVAADSAFTSLRDQAQEAITGFYHLPAFPFVNLAVLGYELYFQTGTLNIAPESVIAKISPVPVPL